MNKKDESTDTLRRLGVPYHSRWSDSTFLRECNPMAHPSRSHSRACGLMGDTVINIGATGGQG